MFAWGVAPWHPGTRTKFGLSSCEAEYASFTDSVRDFMLLQQVLGSLLPNDKGRRVTVGDVSAGVIRLANNPLRSVQSKHIVDVRCSFARNEA